MKKSNKNKFTDQTTAILSAIKIHFYFLFAYAASIIAFDSWNLIGHEAVAQRWTYGGLLAILCCILWFTLKRYGNNEKIVLIVTYCLIIADIAFATVNVYAQRGMASKAVMLFVIPLIVASYLKDRITLLTTAGLCIAAYSMAAIRYFHLFYGEGYRVELYGEVGFYSAVIFVIALLLLPRTSTRN